MTAYDDILRTYREFKRYTGDGLPGEPTGASLPIGDPQSGPHNPKKSELRATLSGLAQDLLEGIAYVDGIIPALEAAAAGLIDQAEAARDAAEGAAETVVVARYNSKAGVEAATIDAAVQSIELTGYAEAGDGGGMEIYDRVVSEPAHDGKIQSLDGAWWELKTNTPSVGAFGVLPGNTAATNATALARVETFERAAFDLAGEVALPAGTYPRKLIQGNGSLVVGGDPHTLNVPGQSARDYLHRLFGRIGNLDTLAAAIRNEAVKVALWGDSITEGLSQIDYEDSWAGLIEAELRRRYPDVTWVFGNFSLPGQGIGDAASAAFVAAASEGAVTPGVNFWHADGADMVPPNFSLWPGGTTTGDSWAEHVEAFNPHLVIIALGINLSSDGPTNTYDNMTLLTNVVSDIDINWASNPSVAIVTPMLPTRETGLASPPLAVQAIADSMRSMAVERDYTLIDSNALYRSYLDGVDVTRTRKRVISDFADFPDWTDVTGTRPSVAGSTMTFAAASGWVVAPYESMDGTWNANWLIDGSGDIADVTYRADPSNPGTGFIARIQRTGASIGFEWYYGATLLNSEVVSTADDDRYHVVVEARGAHHKITVNGVTVVDNVSYRWVKAGLHGLAGYGTVSVTDYRARLGYPAVIGHGIFREEDLLGLDDWGDDWSLGGNAINHPTVIGHRAVYFDACAALLRGIEMKYSQRPPQAAVYEAISTATAIAAGDEITVSITPVGGVETYAPEQVKAGGDANNVFASNRHAKIVTGSGFRARMIKNSATVMISQDFVFLNEGTWLVDVLGFATKATAGNKANITATAIQVR